MKDLFISCVAYVALMLANLASGILAARLLGPDGRGELAAVMLWPGLISAVGGLGIIDAVIYTTANRSAPPARIFASSMALGIGLSAILMAVGLLIVPLAYTTYGPEIRDMAYLYLLFIPVNLLGLYTAGMFQGGLKLGLWNLLRVLVSVAYVMFILAFVLTSEVSVRSFVFASLLGNGATLVVSVVLIGREGWISYRPDFRLVKRLLQYGSPIHLGAVLMIANERLDQMLISQWLQAAEFGTYVVALGVSGALSAFVSLIAALAYPKISCQPSPAGKALVFGRYMRLAAAAAAAGAALLIALAPWVLQLLFGSNFLPAAPILRVLGLGVVPFACKTIFILGFKAYDQLGPIVRAELVALLLNAAALVALLNAYGAVGAACALVIAHCSAAAYLAVAARQTLGLSLAALFRPSAADLQVVAASLRIRRR